MKEADRIRTIKVTDRRLIQLISAIHELEKIYRGPETQAIETINSFIGEIEDTPHDTDGCDHKDCPYSTFYQDGQKGIS